MGFLGGLDICGGWIEDSWDLEFVKSRSTTQKPTAGHWAFRDGHGNLNS